MNKLFAGVLAALSVPMLSSPVVAANDPDSIGRTVKYLDYAAGKSVLMATAVASATPCDPNIYNCFILNETGTGTFDVPNLTSVEIGANSSRALICSSIQYNASYFFRNFATDSTVRRSSMLVQPSVKIESAALTDLNLVNPLTGVPFNGAIVRPMSSFLDEANLAAGQIEQHAQNWSSDCTRGILSRAMLMKEYGLSSTVAQRVMTRSIKITVGVNIINSNMYRSNFNLAVRMYSD